MSTSKLATADLWRAGIYGQTLPALLKCMMWPLALISLKNDLARLNLIQTSDISSLKFSTRFAWQKPCVWIFENRRDADGGGDGGGGGGGEWLDMSTNMSKHASCLPHITRVEVEWSGRLLELTSNLSISTPVATRTSKCTSGNGCAHVG